MGVQNGGVGLHVSSTDAQQIMSFRAAEHSVPVSMTQDRWVRFLLADNLVPNLPPSFKMIWWTGLAVGGFRTLSPPDVDGFVPYRTPSVNT